MTQIKKTFYYRLIYITQTHFLTFLSEVVVYETSSWQTFKKKLLIEVFFLYFFHLLYFRLSGKVSERQLLYLSLTLYFTIVQSQSVIRKTIVNLLWVLIGSISPPKLILSRPQINKLVTGFLKKIWKGTRYLTVVKSSILAPLKSIRYQFIRMLILKWLTLFRLFYNIVVKAIVIFNNI